MSANIVQPRRILIVSQCLLGDTLALLPALHALRNAFPGARIHLVSDAHGEGKVFAGDILGGCGLVDGFHGMRVAGSRLVRLRDRLRLVCRLRRSRWDVGLVLIPPYPPLTQALVRRLDLYLRLAGVRRRILPIPAAPRREPDGRLACVAHVSDALLAQLTPLGIRTPPAGEGLFLLPELPEDDPLVKTAAERMETAAHPDTARLALAPGSNMPSKRWPVERYADVLTELAGHRSLTVFLFGSRAEEDLCRALASQVPHLPCHVVAGEPIGLVAEMVRRCDLYLGNDTGLMHLAAAVGTRCVAVFSARDLPGAWHPYGQGHTVLRTRIECEGCLGVDCPLGTYACIRAISVPDVAAACLTILRDI